eukprot:1875509-Rhodomonas_salina.1
MVLPSLLLSSYLFPLLSSPPRLLPPLLPPSSPLASSSPHLPASSLSPPSASLSTSPNPASVCQTAVRFLPTLSLTSLTLSLTPASSHSFFRSSCLFAGAWAGSISGRPVAKPSSRALRAARGASRASPGNMAHRYRPATA